jgi:hypothetical protein
LELYLFPISSSSPSFVFTILIVTHEVIILIEQNIVLLNIIVFTILAVSSHLLTTLMVLLRLGPIKRSRVVHVLLILLRWWFPRCRKRLLVTKRRRLNFFTSLVSFWRQRSVASHLVVFVHLCALLLVLVFEVSIKLVNSLNLALLVLLSPSVVRLHSVEEEMLSILEAFSDELEAFVDLVLLLL